MRGRRRLRRREGRRGGGEGEAGQVGVGEEIEYTDWLARL